MIADLSHITVVLVRPQQPGNIGVAARAIANHGIGRMALVAPPHFDPERARWMAPKSHHVIDDAHYCETVEEAVASSQWVVATTARPRTRTWPVSTPEEIGVKIADALTPTAILFGPEDSGLSNDDLRMAQHLLHFPTTAISSINLGQAVTATAASLAAAHRSSVQTDQPANSPAPVGKRAEVVRRAVGVLETAGYLNGRSEEMVANTLVRLAGRADLTEDEVNNLLGMVKHLGWWSENR